MSEAELRKHLEKAEKQVKELGKVAKQAKKITDFYGDRNEARFDGVKWNLKPLRAALTQAQQEEK